MITKSLVAVVGVVEIWILTAAIVADTDWGPTGVQIATGATAVIILWLKASSDRKQSQAEHERARQHVESLDQKVIVVKDDVGKVKEDVHKVEVSTNSMKDALVKATADAAKMEGHAQGVQEEKVRVADLKEQTMQENQK